MQTGNIPEAAFTGLTRTSAGLAASAFMNLSVFAMIVSFM
uniref:Uncharacterized protein n=1 Tax=Faecalibaculum rodentium TaxID=1702221 RepID=A0A140DV98_9FIRM|nr:hypothetical protein AALO17_14410 [Faecalibaculum rodentium]